MRGKTLCGRMMAASQGRGDGAGGELSSRENLGGKAVQCKGTNDGGLCLSRNAAFSLTPHILTSGGLTSPGGSRPSLEVVQLGAE